MGNRITIRAKNRAFPTVFHAAQKTVAELFEQGYVGPFTPNRLAELALRAREIRITCGAIDAVMQLRTYDLLPVTSERQVLRAWYGVTPPLQFASEDGNAFLAWPGPAWDGPNGPRANIARDENGALWFAAGGSGYFLSASDADPPTMTVAINGQGSGSIGSTYGLDGSIGFSYSRTVPALFFIYDPVNFTTDATLAIVKWWEYQTSAGVKAWDEDTGEELNGGPAR